MMIRDYMARINKLNAVMNKKVIPLPEGWHVNGFLSGDYEVRFLQDDRLTVCVIRHVKKLGVMYSGISVRHPKDRFDDAVGRHKAFKKALDSSKQEIRRLRIVGVEYTLLDEEYIIEYPLGMNVSHLQRDYWKRYGQEEK
jgi:hypothetical protein